MPIITECITKISTKNFFLKHPKKNIIKEILTQNIIINKYPHWKLMAETIQDTLLLGESASPVNLKAKKRFSLKNLNPYRARKV